VGGGAREESLDWRSCDFTYFKYLSSIISMAVLTSDMRIQVPLHFEWRYIVEIHEKNIKVIYQKKIEM
jgi:hypothetical protein